MKKTLFFLCLLSFILFGCSSDDNGGIQNPDPTPVTSADFPVQSFMWNALNLWYFWQADVPVLADDRFANDQEFTQFLQQFPNPFDLWENELLFVEDRFSFLNEDYTELVSGLAGVSRSNGLEFGLQFIAQGSDDVFGYVQYILPDSDAASKDISRGEFFTHVDGVQLTGSNFRSLLFGDNANYTLGMANLNNGSFSLNGKEVALTKIENFAENPIQVATTLDVNGTKVAYLMYNRFLRSFNNELNDAFAQFVADGATELVLDMRYNPGGSVNTSKLLASMIHSTDTGKLYIRQRWNPKIQVQLSPEQLEDRFASSFRMDTSDENSPLVPINTLNLNRVFILTTGSSASASELIINGLAPYMNITQIGETTSGKNEFSITLVDDPGGSFIYNPEREGLIPADSQWGLQPLVGRNENADGFFDYTDGLDPDIELEEDLTNLGILGDVNEPLLARALQEINGAVTRRGFNVQIPAHSFTSSRVQTVIKDNMYLDKPIKMNQ
ncbi:S41 family peptidase [Flagellimonas sp. S174]|uniref:S41 family peptidase n=1 Tax=Flagellimonas sp. S174 TaxID=3410790 RepID=UPI003BF549F2